MSDDEPTWSIPGASVSVTFEMAKRERGCKGICTIQPGDLHLAVYEGPGFRSNYCLPCAKKYLDKAMARIQQAIPKLKEIQDQVADLLS